MFTKKQAVEGCGSNYDLIDKTEKHVESQQLLNDIINLILSKTFLCPKYPHDYTLS